MHEPWSLTLSVSPNAPVAILARSIYPSATRRPTARLLRPAPLIPCFMLPDTSACALYCIRLFYVVPPASLCHRSPYAVDSLPLHLSLSLPVSSPAPTSDICISLPQPNHSSVDICTLLFPCTGTANSQVCLLLMYRSRPMQSMLF